MKALSGFVGKSLPIGAEVNTCDNSGAKVVKIIGVKGHKTVRRRLSSGAVGDLVVVSVIKGKPDMRKKVVQAVVVRTKKEIFRDDGSKIQFDSNAVVLADEKGEPIGTRIFGPVTRELRASGYTKIISLAPEVI